MWNTYNYMIQKLLSSHQNTEKFGILTCNICKHIMHTFLIRKNYYILHK